MAGTPSLGRAKLRNSARFLNFGVSLASAWAQLGLSLCSGFSLGSAWAQLVLSLALAWAQLGLSWGSAWAKLGLSLCPGVQLGLSLIEIFGILKLTKHLKSGPGNCFVFFLGWRGRGLTPAQHKTKNKNKIRHILEFDLM